MAHPLQGTLGLGRGTCCSACSPTQPERLGGLIWATFACALAVLMSAPLLSSASVRALSLLLDTQDFGCWQAVVGQTLGHHQSTLLSPREPFQARMQIGQVGAYSVLRITGKGRLHLNREQVHHSVLWLPLRGMSEERVNGEQWLAEPGQALLFQPGDQMVGETSQELEGVSILIPPPLQPRPASRQAPLLSQGPLHQAILRSARQLATAALEQPLGAEQGAEPFTEALRAWTSSADGPLVSERITARRRRDTVHQAREWMGQRLQERFGVHELSEALEVSSRQLQYSFLQELGRSPMAEAKRLRLHHLRALLRDPLQSRRSIAELMAASGLVASGVTSADYRRWCGESPRQTRRQLRCSSAQTIPSDRDRLDA